MLWIILKAKLQKQTNENHNWIEQTKVNKFKRRIFVNSDTDTELLPLLVAVDKNVVFWDWIPAVERMAGGLLFSRSAFFLASLTQLHNC